MVNDTKQWLCPRRKAAGFSSQDSFALALKSHRHKSISERDVRGWENCDKNYRRNVPYQAIATVLNEHPPEDKQITEEQLRQDHNRDIRHCEINEQRQEAHIDEPVLRQAIECCDPNLKGLLLKEWNADGNVGLAAHNVAEAIRAGEPKQVLLSFSRVFEKVLPVRVERSPLCEQVWRVVDAVARACIIPGTEYKVGQGQKVATDQAWLIRIRLLVKENLHINGLKAKPNSELDDDGTHAFFSEGVSPLADPLERVWELVCRLVERYEAKIGDKDDLNYPPNPKSDHAAFKKYCDSLNNRLVLDSVAPTLFFHLMTKPESDEVTELLYQYLSDLMSFISHETEGPCEGLFFDNEALLGNWIARWLYRTGHVFVDDISNQETSYNKSTEEKSKMGINIEVKNSPGASINAGVGENTQSNAQNGIDPSQILPLLEQLLKATNQEPSPPTELRREIRHFQSEIEDNKSVPSDLMSRLTAAIPTSLTLGVNTTTIIKNIEQLWRSAFGGGV